MSINKITSPEKLQKILQKLREERRPKAKVIRKYSISKSTRELIHSKTSGKCHVCGIKVLINNFQADHVMSHTHGGTSLPDNFLPACKTCNRARWHYTPDEMQFILKLGVWAKTQIQKDTALGQQMASELPRRK